VKKVGEAGWSSAGTKGRRSNAGLPTKGEGTFRVLREIQYWDIPRLEFLAVTSRDTNSDARPKIMVCPQCSHANPTDSPQCERCCTPLPLPQADQETIRGESLRGWSVPAEAHTPIPAKALAPGEVIAERYEIIRLLGQGGMGAVYHAQDRALDRDVALKVIRADMAANPQILNRFKQELLLARQVTHRNVIRIFDLGQAEGLKFITMEYIEGEDLQALLRREKKLPPERAAQIMVQVCRALEAAHAEGVIHRDLKPQNIMIGKGGRACVMDFGIARSMLSAGMTETGAVIGTPDYMSPEQAKGLPVDARSDIFSFGIIFYEMLSGLNPFDADTTMGKLWKRTSETARPPSELDKGIPQPLSDIVKKCLELEPDKRFFSTTELLRAIETWQGVKGGSVDGARASHWKWVAVGTAALVVVLLALMLRPKVVSTPTQHPPVSMLVADFDNKTGDPIFSGTLEPMLGIALEGAPFISAFDRGAARKEAMQLQPGASSMDAKLAQLVAQREGIGLVVTGSIAPQGRGGYQVYAMTLDGATGQPIVKEQEIHAASKEDVLAVAGKLAERIRKGLGDSVPAGAQQSAGETYTATSLIAAHDYAEGQSLQQQGKIVGAIAAYRRALELDPDMGRAYAGIAACSQNLGRISDAEENYKLALARIDRMTDREKYRTRGGYYLLMHNDAKAFEEFSALVKEYPADTAGHANLAYAYFLQRNMGKALEEEKQATSLTAHSVLQQSNYSQYALYGGDFEVARIGAAEILKSSPQFEIAARTMALAQLAEGHVDEAQQSYANLQGMSARGASMAATGLADVALYEGRLGDTEDVLEKAVKAELAANETDGAANDGATLALAELALKKTAQARAAAAQAGANSKDEGVLYRVAQVYLALGDQQRALATVAPLAQRIETEPQIYPKLIAGEAQLKSGKAHEALSTFQDTQKLRDTWLGHFDLGLAYLQLGAFIEASSEFDTCLKRRGEATAVFLDDNPSYHLVPEVYYYQGRAREGLHSAGAAESYRTFIAIKEKGEGDALVADAKRRVGSMK
jgi:eukaryotic-like serine/threonine-protein kinase